MNSALPDPATWQRIEGYLDTAFELQPDARECWLAELDSTQPSLAKMIRELLAEGEALNASGFLEGSPIAAAGLPQPLRAPAAGDRVGAYVIERLLGRGGMGEVWLATREPGQGDERSEARCAIKFLDVALEEPRFTKRFLREGQLLARLEHPNIVRLLEAGTTQNGRQFLVLEYVDGESIDKHCESGRLDIRERVRLFLGAVAAIAYAHSNQVIHRDLKPSNVLVTREGTIKLLDFGIARSLCTDGSLDDSHTRIGEAALTPEYAAPEQLMGDPPSTASDVYQLGMLLYVLLTRRHHLKPSASRTERIKAALESPVPLASSIATGDVGKELRGNLDAILAMALQSEPGRRYASAESFRDDLVRYLEREPVHARRVTPMSLARRVAVRHRLAACLSTAAVVAICAAALFALGR